MKSIPTKELMPGMVLAEHVVTQQSNRLIEKGTILSSKDIAKLAFYSISEVQVEEDAIDQMITERPYAEELSHS